MCHVKSFGCSCLHVGFDANALPIAVAESAPDPSVRNHHCKTGVEWVGAARIGRAGRRLSNHLRPAPLLQDECESFPAGECACRRQQVNRPSSVPLRQRSCLRSVVGSASAGSRCDLEKGEVKRVEEVTCEERYGVRPASSVSPQVHNQGVGMANKSENAVAR